MYYANCEWYVDMGKHNKPLCKRKNLRPAKCSECPVYIRSVEKENAKLREQVAWLKQGDVLHVLTDQELEDKLDEKRCMQASINALDGENEKLRELVRKMMRFLEDGDYCVACEKVAECHAQEEYDDDCLMRGVFHAAMRELGIEVG